MSADASDAKRMMSMSTGSLGLPSRHKIGERDQIYEHHRRLIKEHIDGLVVSIFLVIKKHPALRVACRAGVRVEQSVVAPATAIGIFARDTAIRTDGAYLRTTSVPIECRRR